MARNDIVLLDSLVTKSETQLGKDLDEFEIFELFTFDQILKEFEPSFEELESGWTDGGNDGGIDGFFVFVDGRIATPESPAYASKRCPKIDVHILTVTKSPKFEQKPLDSLIGSLGELLDLSIDVTDLKYPYNEFVLQQRELFKEIYISLADRQPIQHIQVHYCSRGNASIVATNLKSRASILHSLLEDLFSNAEINVAFVGASELLASARKQRDFTLRLPFIESYISREGNNYIILCRLSDYFNFISDEEGKLRRYLFESNVRDYLGEVLINKDIYNTLASRETQDHVDFWWLNNGVTILGTNASVAGKELCIENVQIVNGLQTTETVYRFFSESKQEVDQRAILLKVILAADDDTRARIIKATNYQNTVDLASLRGLDKIQHDIEEFLADHGWFYDRKKNFYKNQGKPAERIVSVPYLAAAVRAIALGDPAKSRRQRSRSLRDDRVYTQVFDPTWDLHVFLTSLEITRAIDIALQTRRNVWDTPPIAFVHYIGFAYVCKCLKKFPYNPKDIISLSGCPPNKEEVMAIRNKLMRLSPKLRTAQKNTQIKLGKNFIKHFV